MVAIVNRALERELEANWCADGWRGGVDWGNEDRGQEPLDAKARLSTS